MNWSKIKKQFEFLLAPCLQGRLGVHVTEYSQTSMDIGRGWITYDKEQVVSVQIPSFYSTNFEFRTDTMDFGKAIGTYLTLSIEDAKNSSDELIRGFVFLDGRFGKRSLRETDPDQLHAFSRILYGVRYDAEGLKCQSLIQPIA